MATSTCVVFPFICDRCVTQAVANEARPPIATPARPIRAEMYGVHEKFPSRKKQRAPGRRRAATPLAEGLPKTPSGTTGMLFTNPSSIPLQDVLGQLLYLVAGADEAVRQRQRETVHLGPKTRIAPSIVRVLDLACLRSGARERLPINRIDRPGLSCCKPRFFSIAGRPSSWPPR